MRCASSCVRRVDLLSSPPTMYSGLQQRPPSVHTWISRRNMFQMMPVCTCMRPEHFAALREWKRRGGSRWMPTILPLTKTMVLSVRSATVALVVVVVVVVVVMTTSRSGSRSSKKGSTPSSSVSRRRTCPALVAMVTVVVMARFLTRPTEAPSGVSEGQMMPHCVGCSFLGCTSFPVFSMDVLIRRRCDRVDQ